MGNCIKRKILEAWKYFIFINSYNWKANGLSVSLCDDGLCVRD